MYSSRTTEYFRAGLIPLVVSLYGHSVSKCREWIVFRPLSIGSDSNQTLQSTVAISSVLFFKEKKNNGSV